MIMIKLLFYANKTPLFQLTGLCIKTLNQVSVSMILLSISFLSGSQFQFFYLNDLFLES